MKTDVNPVPVPEQEVPSSSLGDTTNVCRYPAERLPGKQGLLDDFTSRVSTDGAGSRYPFTVSFNYSNLQAYTRAQTVTLCLPRPLNSADVCLWNHPPLDTVKGQL